MRFYSLINEEHWLRDKEEDGQSLILDDNSTWEVHPSDRAITARWLRGSRIVVEKVVVETGEWRENSYVLKNRTLEGEVARVSFLGEFRAAS